MTEISELAEFWLQWARELHNAPDLQFEIDSDGCWIDDDGIFACAHPGAALRRAAGQRCCVGGPCNEPAWASTPEAAAWMMLTCGLANKLGAKR